jgi:hypothetical protein
MTLKKLIWIDGIAALLSALFVLFFKNWLAAWLGLPEKVLYIMCIVSFSYATYSIFLALQNEKPLILLKILVVANTLWAIICTLIIAFHFTNITPFGIVYLLAEAAFVGGLAFFENKKIIAI